MKYTYEALFTLSVCEYTADGKNVVSSHKKFSNADFYKIAHGADFKRFKEECEQKITDRDDFDRFMDAVRKVLDNVCHDSDGMAFVLGSELCAALMAAGQSADGMLSVFDPDFPDIYRTVSKAADKPFLLFYKGDIALLKRLQSNVAVIGLLNPDDSIVAREKAVVTRLVRGGMNIVSGLAKGCDTAAHKACMEAGGKTIAILPSPLAQIYPAENRELAGQIAEKGGLLVTEYYRKLASRFELSKRLIDRDRLQAMLSKAVVLVASYGRDAGDSGARHAMGKAEEYALFRAMLYNDDTDKDNPQFGLNREYYKAGDVSVMTQSVLDEMISFDAKMRTRTSKPVQTQLLLPGAKSC